MVKKLTDILSESGYSSNNERLYMTSVEKDLIKRDHLWREGEVVLVPTTEQSNWQMYTLWEREPSSDNADFIAKDEPTVFANNGSECDGAVKAYRTLGSRCLVVPRPNDLPHTKVVHKLYLLD